MCLLHDLAYRRRIVAVNHGADHSHINLRPALIALHSADTLLVVFLTGTLRAKLFSAAAQGLKPLRVL